MPDTSASAVPEQPPAASWVMGRSARWQQPELRAELLRTGPAEDTAASRSRLLTPVAGMGTPATEASRVLRPALTLASLAPTQPGGPEALFLVVRLLRVLVTGAAAYRRAAR